MSFYSLPYRELGFSDLEWDSVPTHDRRLIRDFVLNGQDIERTTVYEENYDSKPVGTVVRRYDLHSRPKVQISLSELHIY